MNAAPTAATFARIFISEDDRYHGQPLYERLLHLAQDMDLAGATVIRGVEGFGASHTIHSQRVLRSSEDLPMIITVVDERQRVVPYAEQAREVLHEAGCGGLITLEQAEILSLPQREKSPNYVIAS